MNSLTFLFAVYIICIGLSVASLLTTLFFVIPLQIQKVKVKNGLRSLRQKLLAKGVLSIMMSMVTIIVLSSRFFLEGDVLRYINTLLVLCFCSSWFIKQLIESSIYHTQFTEDQIRLHDRIHTLEVREANKARKLTNNG